MRKFMQLKSHTYSRQYCKRTFRNHRAFKDHETGEKPVRIAIQNEILKDSKIRKSKCKFNKAFEFCDMEIKCKPIVNRRNKTEKPFCV